MEPSEEMFIAKSLERIAVALEEHNLHAAEAMQQQQRQIELQQSSQKLVREDLELRRDLAAKADDEKNQFLKLFLPQLATPGGGGPPAPGATLAPTESPRTRRVPRHTIAGGPGQ